MSKPLTVYWAPFSEWDADMNWSIFYREPTPLYGDLARNKNDENPRTFFHCPSFRDHARQTLVLFNPVSSAYKTDGEQVELLRKDSMPAQMIHAPSINNNLLLWYRMPLVMFAEDEVELTITAPYFHKAPHLNYGAVVPGTLNIGAWYRTLNMEFNLWDGINEFHVGEGEPLAYLHLHTDRKVNLVQFKNTRELQALMKTCVASPRWETNVPLVKRYARFRQAKMRDIVLSEIRKNLV